MHHNFYDYQAVRLHPRAVPMASWSRPKPAGRRRSRWTTCKSGALFIAGGEQVYEGQIVGENSRDNDMPVNVCREKKLTNMRAATADKSIILKPPRLMTLELALEYIEEDELVEVTPKGIRMRKIFLKETDRRKYARQHA